MRGFFFAHGVPVASEAQAIFCRRRHQPRRPAPAPSRLNYPHDRRWQRVQFFGQGGCGRPTFWRL